MVTEDIFLRLRIYIIRLSIIYYMIICNILHFVILKHNEQPYISATNHFIIFTFSPPLMLKDNFCKTLSRDLW